MADPSDALRKDVNALGHILGDTLVEQEGEELFALEETIRALAKERRIQGRQSAASAAMRAKIKSLDTKTAERVARAFTHYFQLVNLAEQHHRARRRRDYARSGEPQPGSLADEIGQLAKTLTWERFSEVLSRARIELVFTAHPSEAQRRTVLDKHRRIAHLLARRERAELVPSERAELDAALREEVTILWQTDEVRQAKPRVGDEVKNTLFYLEHVLFALVPRFYDALAKAVETAYGKQERIPTILTFGSWVGADMDGNPNVTPEVAVDTAYAQSARVIALYLHAIGELGETLSQSARRIEVSKELEASIAADAKRQPDLAEHLETTTEDEPYRRKLRYVEARLEATRHALVEGRKTKTFAPPEHAYRAPSEVLEDLRVLARSLEAHGGRRAGLRRVSALARQVETFGFHLARLDVRVPAEWIRGRTDEGREAVKAVARIQALTAGGGAESLIMSMAHGADDMLAALELARDAGLPPEAISIVPLFETLADLERCPGEVERAAKHAEYRKYLDARGGVQEVMIGYSDSNKDAGIFGSSYALYRAQQELVAVGKRAGFALKIFHGRGGSIGRGGGPAQRAIQSLPPGSIDGRFKLTEQGEVLGWKYLLSEIGERNLEVTASGVLAATVGGANIDYGEHERAFADIAKVSVETYRRLVGDPDFIDYYTASTPLEEIARLNIGSRPAKRTQKKQRSLEDLRAIPWVFAWTQSRQMVPGFYGTGRALTHLLRTKGVEYARRMRAEWPFFATTLDAVAVSLATADMAIARRYVELVPDRKVAWRLFRMIALDHGRAARAVKAILGQKTVLEHNPTLARSIELRNPYVDPLSFIQIELLRRKRETDEDDPILSRAVLLTLNGISAGLRNTG
jgi:phosphoenolpyruvate carboxylase